MTINLEDFVDKKVKVTLQGSEKQYNGTLYYNKVENLYYFKGDRYDFVGYTQTGTNIYNISYTIIRIKELPMNTKDILTEINKTKVQLHLLEEKLKQAETQEKFNLEFYTPIAIDDQYANCLKLLKTKNVHYISKCFDWDQTPQGHGYWRDIAIRDKSLDESDIQQIKDWVINYLIQKEL